MPSKAQDPESPKRHYYSLEEPTWKSPGADSRPVWSRDGQEILFQQTREEGIAQIWAVRPDGSGLRRLTDGRFRAGHPDPCSLDDRLALVSDLDGSQQIWILNLETDDLTQLTKGGRAKSWPVFSPDCSRILFTEAGEVAQHDDLHWVAVEAEVEVETGTEHTLLRSVRFLGWPAWSRDGKWALWHREIEGFPNHLWRIRPDGTDAAPMTSGDHGDYWGAELSADGRFLSYSFGRRQQLQWGGNADLWLLDLKSGWCRPLLEKRWHEHGQRFSPDGSRLVYWDKRSGYNEIFVYDLEQETSHQITFQPPTELTRVAREQGAKAAIAYASSRPENEELCTEAFAQLFDDRVREGREPEVELAQVFVNRFPTSTLAATSLARELFRAGALSASRHRYQSLLAEDGWNSDIALRLSILAQLEKSAGKTLRALEEEPLPEAVVNSLGYALLREERFEAATDVFSWNALSRNSRHGKASANAFDSLGEAFYWQGELSTAQLFFRRSLQLDPGNENASRFLERILVAKTKSSSIREDRRDPPCPQPLPASTISTQ
ncbi:MAG: hypothetical protein K0U98_16355 [Deltaproteobacteria bacterium]|nr:hypothetical protein [Deltaproteobacteria bacterium]